VELIETVSDAIAYFKENQGYDLVFMDIHLADGNSFEIVKEVEPIAPIIFTTAMTDTEHKVKAFSLGAVDYITKPFRTTEVLARVRTHLQIRHLNQQLAQQVEQLNDTVDALKRTQAQLVQKEKMSGLGHLVAGIAHEINNPINFIYGNAKHVDTYADNLLTMLRLYQQHHPTPHPDIDQTAEALDIDFISEDLPKLTGSMRDGAHRIHQMVLSLRNFSRLDEAQLKYVDLAEGLDSTLLLLKRRLSTTRHRPAITVVKTFEPLPPVECYPSQLNQVFMNLLCNAIDALDRSPSQQPQITIQISKASSDSVHIAIADNGPGIPAEIQDKVFDPFFTTKPVGQGTGLGLSIGYQIVTDEHQGELSFTTPPAGGTVFKLTLPARQSTPRTPVPDSQPVANSV
ncbi:MAG: ATP-binding protein, partial [Cyanobacteria bacterium J06632_22]